MPGMQLSSGSMAAAKEWSYHPRCSCLLDDRCIMSPTLARRSDSATCFTGLGGLRSPRRVSHLAGIYGLPGPCSLKVLPLLTRVNPES
jgi:hypothetical protein